MKTKREKVLIATNEFRKGMDRQSSINIAFALTLSLLICLAAASTTVRAEIVPSDGCSAIGCIGVFGSIYVDAGGQVRLTVPGGLNTSQLGCAMYGEQYFSLKRNHVAFKEIYAMLLMAQSTNKKLFVRTLENSPDCEVWYAVAYP